MDDYDKFAKELEEVTKELPMKKAVTSKRKGVINWFIDKIVIGRFFWTESFAFLTIIQTIVIFTALIPQSVVTINNFFIWAHLPIALPVAFSSAITILFIVFVFVSGFVVVRYMKTSTRTSEYSAKTNSGSYLLWKKLDNLEKKIEKLEEKK